MRGRVKGAWGCVRMRVCVCTCARMRVHACVCVSEGVLEHRCMCVSVCVHSYVRDSSLSCEHVKPDQRFVFC